MRKELEEAKKENLFLKKAAAFFMNGIFYDDADDINNARWEGRL